MSSGRRDRGAAIRGAVALFALGFVGVAAIAVYTLPSLRAMPDLQALPDPLLLVLAAANSTVLLAVFVVLGTLTAPRCGLRSHVFAWAAGRDPEWGQLRDSIPGAVAVGAAVFVAVVILDVAFAVLVPMAADDLAIATGSLDALVASIPMRLLYGGITEELLLRWGVMAPLAWLGWRLQGRLRGRSKSPTESTMWAAIVLSAVLFGVGHLPALAGTLELTAALVVRTVVLNALAGVGFGYLFWRRSLETAMVAHAAFHVTLVAVSFATVLA